MSRYLGLILESDLSFPVWIGLSSFISFYR
jgi:hypothetical protein